MKNKNVAFMTQAAMIAAIYVVLTYVFAPFSFGEVQILSLIHICISQSMLTNYENGNGTPRDESIWEKLSQIFGVSKSHVMGLTTDIETTQKTNRLKVVVDMSQPVSVHPKNQTELDILVKMDLLDDDDTEKLLCFINELLAKDKYEGRRESAIEYLAE